MVSVKEKKKYVTSYALQNNSEFLGMFNYHISKIKSSGVLSKLSQKWLRCEVSRGIVAKIARLLKSVFVFSPDLSQTADDIGGGGGGGGGEATVLDYTNLVFPFCILAAGIVSSALLLLIEKACRFIRHYFSNSPLPEIPPAAEYIKAGEPRNLLE